MISTRSVGLLIDTVVCLTLAKWETVSGRFGGYFKSMASQWTFRRCGVEFKAAARVRTMIPCGSTSALIILKAIGVRRTVLAFSHNKGEVRYQSGFFPL